MVGLVFSSVFFSSDTESLVEELFEVVVVDVSDDAVLATTFDDGDSFFAEGDG